MYRVEKIVIDKTGVDNYSTPEDFYFDNLKSCYDFISSNFEKEKPEYNWSRTIGYAYRIYVEFDELSYIVEEVRKYFKIII